jgi:hypothetical protein
MAPGAKLLDRAPAELDWLVTANSTRVWVASTGPTTTAEESATAGGRTRLSIASHPELGERPRQSTELTLPLSWFRILGAGRRART